MQYLLLIYSNDAERAAWSPEQVQAELAEYGAFTEECVRRGVLRGGEPLQSVETATTVRVRDGELITTDGPFAETREQLGGYYLLDCRDLDEAIELAAKVPAAKDGSIEIRPLMELPPEYRIPQGPQAASAV